MWLSSNESYLWKKKKKLRNVFTKAEFWKVIIWSDFIHVIEWNYPSEFFERPLSLVTLTEIANKVQILLLQDERWLFFNIYEYFFIFKVHWAVTFSKSRLEIYVQIYMLLWPDYGHFFTLASRQIRILTDTSLQLYQMY